MKKIVIITSKFNIMTGNRNTLYSKNEGIRTTEWWINNRINIFINFTAKSLLQQSNQNFYAVYAIEDSTENLIKSALSKYPKLPDNINFVKKSDYSNYIDTLSKGYDILYLTRLDSDDMYVNDFVDKIYNFNILDDTEVLLCRNGYIYDSVSNKLAEYSHNAFTFYTFIYRLYDEEIKYDSLKITPWDLLINFFHFSTLLYKYKILSERNFIFNIHEENTDSKFPTSSFIFYTLGRFIEDAEEKSNILKTFFF